MTRALRDEASASGIDLLAVGVDPFNGIDRVPLQLHGDRYTAMDAYLAACGPAGPRMMRQTAAFQITADAGDDPAPVGAIGVGIELGDQQTERMQRLAQIAALHSAPSILLHAAR